MAMAIAIVLFLVFIANVASGALANAGFLTDVQEMLLLFAASIAFVVVILKREADSRNQE